MDPNQCLIVIGKLFSKPKYTEMIQRSEQLLCKEAHLHYNERPTIIKEIVHISFPNLTLLHLSYNKIESIEALKFLRAFNLKTLHLSFNPFTTAKTLRKCFFPNLQKLSLMNTKILQFQCFSQFQFPKMNNLLLEEQLIINAAKRASSIQDAIIPVLSPNLMDPSNHFQCCSKTKRS